MAVGLRMTGSGRLLADQKLAIIIPTARRHCVRGALAFTDARTMDKATLPRGYAGRKPRIPLFVKLLAFISLASLTFFGYWLSYFPERNYGSQVPFHAAEIQARCRALNTKPGPPSDFHHRAVSDRFVEGTKNVWIRNATIWTGRLQGLEIIKGDVFLTNGIIKSVGRIDLESMGFDHREVDILDAHGAYVTPGCVSCHWIFLPSGLKHLPRLGSSTSIHIWVLDRLPRSRVLGT